MNYIQKLEKIYNRIDEIEKDRDMIATIAYNLDVNMDEIGRYYIQDKENEYCIRR